MLEQTSRLLIRLGYVFLAKCQLLAYWDSNPYHFISYKSYPFDLHIFTFYNPSIVRFLCNRSHILSYINTFANSRIKIMVFPDSCSIGFTYGYSHLTPSG